MGNENSSPGARVFGADAKSISGLFTGTNFSDEPKEASFLATTIILTAPM